MATTPHNSPRGYQQIGAVALATATGLTLPDASCTRAMISSETADVRWRDDGVDPTASIGMVLKADGVLIYEGDLSKIKFILVSGSPKLNVSFY